MWRLLSFWFLTGTLSAQSDQPTIFPIVRTAPLASYDERPATPDADDPAIWINRRRPQTITRDRHGQGCRPRGLRPVRSPVQALLPPNAPQILEADPPTPGGQNRSGQPLHGQRQRRDLRPLQQRRHRLRPEARQDTRRRRVPTWPWSRIAAVTVCASSRSIRPTPTVHSSTSPRPCPARLSRALRSAVALQPSGDSEGWAVNPLDDQNTVYGLDCGPGPIREVFVTERERGLVRHLHIDPTATGTPHVSARPDVSLRYELRSRGRERGASTPGRRVARRLQEEPQSEGLVFDTVNVTLVRGVRNDRAVQHPSPSPRRTLSRSGETG